MNLSFFNNKRFAGKLLSISLITGLALAFSGIATASTSEAPSNYPYVDIAESELENADIYSNLWVDDSKIYVQDENADLRVYNKHSELLDVIDFESERGDLTYNSFGDLAFTNEHIYLGIANELVRVDKSTYEYETVREIQESDLSNSPNGIQNVMAAEDGIYLVFGSSDDDNAVLALNEDYSTDFEAQTSVLAGLSNPDSMPIMEHRYTAHPNNGIVMAHDGGLTHLKSNGNHNVVDVNVEAHYQDTISANQDHVYFAPRNSDAFFKFDADLNELFMKSLPESFLDSDKDITAFEDGVMVDSRAEHFVMTDLDGNVVQHYHEIPAAIDIGTDGNLVAQIDEMFKNLKVFKESSKSETVESDSTIPDYQTELGVITGEFSASSLDSDLGLSSVFGSLIDAVFGSDTSDKDAFIQELASSTIILEDDRSQMFNDYQLALDTSKGIAAGEAKVEGVKALNNDRTESYAQEIGEERVNEFYADIERRMYAQWNREVLNFQNQLEQGKALDLTYNDAFEGVGFGDTTNPANEITVVSEKRTLLDGDEQLVYQIVDGDGYVLSLEDDLPSDSYSLAAITVDVEDDTPTIITTSTYNNLLDDMYEQHATDLNNAETIISGIYADYNAGDIDITDVIGPLEALKHLGTEYSSSGSLDYAALTYEQAGLHSDLNASFTVQYQNQDMSSAITREGQLFVSHNDFNVIETDVEYNAADKQAYMVMTGEDVETVNLDGNFTVQSIENPDTGEELNETIVEDSPTYETDVEELEEQLSDYQERISEIREASSFIPASGFGFGDLGYGVIAILAAILAGVVLS